MDDEPSIAELLRSVLDACDYEVTVVDSALGVPALVRSLQPDAILLDIGLPYRSGAAVLAELKADPRTANIPVIVVTGMAESLASERRALSFDVISKPFDVARLLDTVRDACFPAGEQRASENPP
ncbi:MAG: response regulator [Chloroflexota bacterium]|nr:response regulator [Chloroflexota bacterium]